MIKISLLWNLFWNQIPDSERIPRAQESESVDSKKFWNLPNLRQLYATIITENEFEEMEPWVKLRQRIGDVDLLRNRGFAAPNRRPSLKNICNGADGNLCDVQGKLNV